MANKHVHMGMVDLDDETPLLETAVDNLDGTYSRQIAASVTVSSGPATIADGADMAQGTTTDAAVQGDTAGTTEAKLRGLNKAVGTNADAATVASILGYLAWLKATNPALGQALAAASVPVVLTSAQQTALTPPAAITGFALDTSLGTIDTDLKANITLHAGTNIVGKVTTDQTTHGTTDLVAADITKIGGTAPTTAGKLDVKGADGDVFVRQTTGSNLHVVNDAGSAIIGKVTTDQTTHGTTDLVAGDNYVGGSAASGTNPMPVYAPASVCIQQVLATTANSYAAGNAIGSAALTLASAVRANGGTGVIQSLVVFDKAFQNAAFDLLLFNAAPTNTPSDKTAYVLSPTDITSLIGVVHVPASAYTTYGGASQSSCGVVTGIGLVFKAGATTTSIYAVAVSQGTPTYTANCVEITTGILRD